MQTNASLAMSNCKQACRDWKLCDKSMVNKQMHNFEANKKVYLSQIKPFFFPKDCRCIAYHKMIYQRLKNNNGKHIEDEDINEMIDMFFDIDLCENVKHFQLEAQIKDPILEQNHKLASTSLFEGLRALILKSSLFILKFKFIYGWNDASINALFSLLKSTILIESNGMPQSRNVAKKILSYIGGWNTSSFFMSK